MLVPPAVTQMAEELDLILSKIIDDEYAKMQYADNNMNNYLSQFELPQILSQSPPELSKDHVQQIMEFQSYGGVQRIIKEVGSLATQYKQISEQLAKAD